MRRSCIGCLVGSTADNRTISQISKYAVLILTTSHSAREIMKLFTVLFLLASLCCCRSTLSSHQAILAEPESEPKREKVPGDNPAYYSREKACDQLFRIDDFTVSPNPARM
jgi:hypothetical protein